MTTFAEIRDDVEADRHVIVNGQYVLLSEYRERKSARQEAIAGVILVAVIAILFYATAYTLGW